MAWLSHVRVYGFDSLLVIKIFPFSWRLSLPLRISFQITFAVIGSGTFELPLNDLLESRFLHQLSTNRVPS